MELSRARLHALTSAAHDKTAAELRPGCDVGACATVAKSLAATFDAEFAAALSAGVACGPGCDFCCHLRVRIFPHEAIALWRQLRTAIPPEEATVIERRLRDNARRIDGMTVAEHHAARIPCAYLIDGRCSAHEVRPSACAAYHSVSRARCEQGYRQPQHAGTPRNGRPALLELKVCGDALIEATEAGLVGAGRSRTKGELHQLLRHLLDDPTAAARWCEGGALSPEGRGEARPVTDR